MPSPPTLFDDEGDDRDRDRNRDRNRGHGGEPAGGPARDHDGAIDTGATGRGAAPETDAARADAPEGGGVGRRSRRRQATAARHPNYRFRRTVAIGGVVAVFAAGGLLVANLVGTGAGTATDGSASVEWNRVVTVDERTGVLVVADGDGEELARRRPGLRNITDIGVVDATAVLGTDGMATVIDLSDDSVEPESVTLGADGITRPSGSALTMLVPARAASRGLIVHGPSGDRIDTDAFAPVAGARYEFGAARSDPSGRHVLVTDSGNFQSVLFSFDRTAPSFFPGLALAVDGDSVVTAQNVGNDATVSVFDHAGAQLGSARTPSVRAAILTGDTVRLVTVDGRIVDLDIGTGDTSDGAQLDIGTVTEGHVGTAGDRLIVVGSAGTAIVADDGRVVDSYEGLVPRETATPAAPLGTRCLSLGEPGDESGGGTGGGTGSGQLVVIDTTSGDVVAEARSVGTIHPSADGCAVVTPAADGIDVLDADGVRRIDVAGTLVAVTPDATRIVVERDGRLVLTPLPDSTDTEGDSDTADGSDTTDDTTNDEGDDDGVDIGPSGRLVAFTDL